MPGRTDAPVAAKRANAKLAYKGDRVVLLFEAAIITGLSAKTLKRRHAEGAIKLIKISERRWGVLLSELERWLATKAAGTA